MGTSWTEANDDDYSQGNSIDSDSCLIGRGGISETEDRQAGCEGTFPNGDMDYAIGKAVGEWSQREGDLLSGGTMIIKSPPQESCLTPSLLAFRRHVMLELFRWALEDQLVMMF